MNTDRIEKQIILKASRERVWRALSESQEFGYWFGVKFAGPFVPGMKVRGVLAPSQFDPEVALKQKAHEGKAFDFVIEKMEPQRLFSFRWHPFAIEPGVDYSAEPMTLVEFTIEEAGGGVKLTVVESGFDQIPLERRAKAFAANDSGWATMIKVVGAYAEAS